jgi:light-regulated signal transduction histidine kinase (bacteriophytochrome)
MASELEQFAYVASHDLQEPLRMVARYTQLLRRAIRAWADQDADEFIGYTVDGATRMRALIRCFAGVCRGSDPPRVHVSAERQNKAWLFSVRANGFGIERQYHDRIFVIF